MANVTKASLKSKLRQSNANYFDDLADSITTLADGGVLAAGSVLGIGMQTIAAAGSNQGTATEISATGGTLVQVTVADNSKGVVLPALSAVTVGTMFLIFNNLSNKTLEVYPASGDGINPASDDAGITIAADTIMLCIALDSAEWIGAEFNVVAA